MKKLREKIDQRYELVRSLGSGLSGEVLLVQDSDGLKALKFLKNVQMSLSREDALKNFKNEFSVLKELNHPNIARIIDFGYEPRLQKYFYTAEYIDGVDFQKGCEGNSLVVIEPLALQILRALSYLHSRRIFHFDIKPQNILVAMREGKPEAAKLIDFGLAGFSSSGKMAGSPAYMAPEVIQGGPLDGRADLYSFGVVLYKALTGANPFVGKSLAETIAKQLSLVPPAPSRQCAGLPSWWDLIITRLLEKDPARRYSQASLVIRDLNFLSNHHYELETHDTKLSYLPERGSLIGRIDEWQLFTDEFSAIFEAASTHNQLLIVSGAKGTGKTRLLSEMKSHIQLRNVSVKSLEQYDQEAEKSQAFVLMIDDDRNEHLNRVNILRHELAKHRCLIIWATKEAPQNWHDCQVISLNNYDKEQLRLYVESVTGLTQIPPKITDEIYNRTLGNPFFVTEFIKSLLQQDALFASASGKWKATTFDDIVIDFDKIRIPATIEELLLAQFYSLSEQTREILFWIAANDEPLAQDKLQHLFNWTGLDEQLSELERSNVLVVVKSEGRYAYKNRSYADLIRVELEKHGELAARHDWLAVLFAGKESESISYLYHIGHGTDWELAMPALRELAAIYVKKAAYNKAISLYERIQSFLTGTEDLLWFDIQFKMGQAYLSQRQFEKARLLFEELSKHLSLTGNLRETDFLEIANPLSETYLRLELLPLADAVIARAEQILVPLPEGDVQRVIFQNHRAMWLFKSGRADEAIIFANKAYKAWFEHLKIEDKYKVQNCPIPEILMFRKNFERLIAFITGHVDLQKRLGIQYKLAWNLYVLGEAYRNTMEMSGQIQNSELIDKCLEAFRESERVARGLGHDGDVFRCLNGIGNVHQARGDMAKALDSYERALLVAQKTEPEIASTIAMNISIVHKHLGQYHDAYTHLVYSINNLEALANKAPNLWGQLCNSYIELADVQIERREFLAAKNALDESSRIMECNGLTMYLFWVRLFRGKLFYHEALSAEGDREFHLAAACASTSFERDVLRELREDLAVKARANFSISPFPQ